MEQRKLQEMKNGMSEEGFIAHPARRQLIERWKQWMPSKDQNGRPIGMKPYNQWVYAQLLENQLNELKNFKEKHMLGEDTTTVNTAPFIKYTFPLLRRVWPALIAPEIVSVQPMTAPVGAVFYFELKYGDTKGTVQAGQKLVKDFNRFYSSEHVDGETAFTTGTGSGTNLAGALKYIPVRPGTVHITSTAVSGEITDDGSNVLTGTGQLALTSPGSIDYVTGAITGTLATARDRSALVAVYDYNMEDNRQVPSVNIDIALVAVTAKSRKIKSLWSSEAADDLKALHGIDAEQELVSGVGSELALEIDREIIEDLKAGATGATTTWDYNFTADIPETDHIRSVLTPMALIANQIGKNTLRGPANFAVMSYDFSSVIEQMGTHMFFRPVWAGGDAQSIAPVEAPQTWGVHKMGTLHGRYVCYKDPYLTSSKVIFGYKGNSFVDAGYAWAPYIPLQVTATFLDPNDFVFRKGLRTRYAKLLARPEFYGILNVSHLPSLSPGAFGPV